MQRTWARMEALSHGDASCRQRLEELENELWVQQSEEWVKQNPSSERVQKNKEAQQQYHAHSDTDRREFEQDLLAFWAKLDQAARAVDCHRRGRLADLAVGIGLAGGGRTTPASS